MARHRIPESHEAHEHGNREFDRRDARYEKALFLIAGIVIGIAVMGALWALSP
jgi:hypothetical protein